MPTYQNSSLSEKIAYFFLNLFAIIVKRFPKWAMRYTVKTNLDADLFVLPHKKEIKLLTTMSIEEVKKHLWSEETQIYILENAPTHFLAFVDNIINREQFEAFINNVKITKEDKQKYLKKIIAQKSYTLNDKQIIRVCKEFDCMLQLYISQPQKITLGLVETLTHDELLQLLAIASDKQTDCTLSKNVISFFIAQYKVEKDDKFNLLIELTLEKAIKGKHIFNPQDIQQLEHKNENLVDRWLDTIYPTQEICDICSQCSLKTLQKFWNRCYATKEAVLMAQITSCCWSRESSFIQKIAIVLDMGQPLPHLFGYLRHKNENTLFQLNFDLCEKKNLLSKMNKSEVPSLSPENFRRYVISMAKNDALQINELQTIKDVELKEIVKEILEQNAQIAWIKQLLANSSKLGNEFADEIATVELCDKAQMLLFQKTAWLKQYQCVHRLCRAALEKMMDDDEYVSILQTYIEQQKITPEEYELLLLSQSKHIAPWAKSYII